MIPTWWPIHFDPLAINIWPLDGVIENFLKYNDMLNWYLLENIEKILNSKSWTFLKIIFLHKCSLIYQVPIYVTMKNIKKEFQNDSKII